MIESFKHKGLKRLFEEDDRSRLPPDMADRITRIISLLDVASKIQDMDQPSLRLHALKGERTGCFSVTVNGNWRVVFRFDQGNAVDVDYLDYH